MDELLGLISSHLDVLDKKGNVKQAVEVCGGGASALAAASGERSHLEAIYEGDGVEILSRLSVRWPKDSLLALVNVTAWASEQGERTIDEVVDRMTRKGALASARRATEDEESREAALKLLQNATTRPEACEELADSFLTMLRGFSRSEDESWALFGGTLRNMTAHSANVRKILLKRSTNIMRALLPQLTSSSSNVERRIGIAAALKHCAKDKDEHYYLDDELHAPIVILRALADEKDIDKLRNEEKGEEVAECFTAVSVGKREEDPQVALFLLEALQCFCATRRCRRRLKSVNAYAIVRDADLAFAPGEEEEDGDDATQAKGVLVTADDSNKEEQQEEESGISSRISRVCAEIADMLLRDDGPIEAPPITHNFTFSNENVEDYDVMD